MCIQVYIFSYIFFLLGDSEADCKKTDDEGCGSAVDRHSRSSSSCQNEEGWFVTPPPCFTSVGPADMETTPLENLLIEHPSMSVYHSPTVSSVLPEKRTLASIASNSESLDNDTPIVFEAVKCKGKLPKHPKKKTMKKSVSLDEFKMAPEIILGEVSDISSPVIVEIKKVERSPAEMFPVLAPISLPRVCSPPTIRTYKEVAASLKRRQPKIDVSETKHVKIESQVEDVVDSPVEVLPLEKTMTAVKVLTPKNVMKKGCKPPCPLPHLLKNDLQKMPKEIIVPKMHAQERLIRLSSFSVIQSDVPKNSKTTKKNAIKTVEKHQKTVIKQSPSCVDAPKPVVLDSEEKKKKKVQQKYVVKETEIEKTKPHPVSEAVVMRPKCDVIEKREQKSPVKKENIIIPLTTSIALNSLVSRPEENAYKHELLKRELAMIAGTNKAQKVRYTINCL